ncbi:MAG: hypothetical protein ACFFE4_00435 [Candidatus Thorarchaeota archaeon]
MSTLIELIRKNVQRPILRCYIKRRDTAGDYEADWVRIDNWKDKQRVINWGSVSLEINHHPGQISKFEVSNLTITVDNQEGHFNIETFDNSLWNGYLNRKFTKLKVEAGYMDTDGTTEIGVANIFEGVIDKVIITSGLSPIAKINILSYQTILKKYDIKDLSLASADRTVENLHADIMNQSKITKFIPYVAATPNIANVVIDDPSTLEGSYWDVLLYLAQITNSIPKLIGDTWSFTSRTPGVSSAFDFTEDDIYDINSYDDEGADRVRLRFQEEDGATFSVASDDDLQLKYLGDTTDGSEVEFVDLSFVKSTNKQSVLDTLVDYWKTPRPLINFTTRFLVNQINPTEKITIDIEQKTIPATGIFRLGISKLGGPDVLGKYIGAISISSSDSWMVTRVIKNLQNWITQIRAEKIIT